MIRAALNERAFERYILTWLSDTNGLLLRYESWALVRDNEASNLLPSIAAGMIIICIQSSIPISIYLFFSLIQNVKLFHQTGLGSILFAVTVDSPELNIISPVETKSLQKPNEIIIAVPVVGSSSDTKSSPDNNNKSTGSKRKQIISFEDDEIESVSSHSSNSIKSPTISLSDACLKYEEKEKQRIESIQAICNDSSYQRIMNLTESPQCNKMQSFETECIEPESPTKIKIYNPVLSAKVYPTTFSSFKIVTKDFDSNISGRTDSSSVESTTTSTSSSSVAAQQSSHPSHSESMTSSIGSINQSVHSVAETNAPTNARLQELEQRCASLEEQITTLTL